MLALEPDVGEMVPFDKNSKFFMNRYEGKVIIDGEMYFICTRADVGYFQDCRGNHRVSKTVWKITRFFLLWMEYQEIEKRYLQYDVVLEAFKNANK